MIPIVYSPEEPGTLIVRGYGPISVWSWDDDFIYDEITLTTTGGTIAAGTEGVFFRDIQNKTYRQTNMNLSSELPSGWEMIVLGIHLHVQGAAATPADVASTIAYQAIIEAVLEKGYCEFILDNSAVLMSGPATRFACPYGLGGHVDVSNAAADAMFGEWNNGLPVATAMPPLQVPIIISDARTFRGTIHFYEACAGLVEDQTIKIQMILHGFKKMPAM